MNTIWLKFWKYSCLRSGSDNGPVFKPEDQQGVVLLYLISITSFQSAELLWHEPSEPGERAAGQDAGAARRLPPKRHAFTGR